MAQGQVRERRASGSPSRTHYLCTSPTRRCGSNRTYSNNSHTLKPFLISFRNTYRQAPVAVHNQLKILWRCSCTAHLVTDLAPLPSLLRTSLLQLLNFSPLPTVFGRILFLACRVPVPFHFSCFCPLCACKNYDDHGITRWRH